MLTMSAGTAKRERDRQTKPRAFITGLETKTGVQGATETKTFCLSYPRVDNLSRLSRVSGEITGQHKDSNLLFCIVTCYCDSSNVAIDLPSLNPVPLAWVGDCRNFTEFP